MRLCGNIAAVSGMVAVMRAAAAVRAPLGEDRLGRYPAELDVPALEGRRYLWTARAFAIGMFLSLAANVALGFALGALVPLQRVEPMLVTFRAKGDQIVRIEPFEQGTRGFDVMAEMLVREYVQVRHEVVADTGEMMHRWGGAGVMRFRSDAGEYERFARETRDLYAKLRADGITRSVTINEASRIAADKWQVEFTTTDYDAGHAMLHETRWLATLTVAFVAQAVAFEDRYMNPLGFVVKDYFLAAKQ